jgi:hypothetical protein
MGACHNPIKVVYPSCFRNAGALPSPTDSKTTVFNLLGTELPVMVASMRYYLLNPHSSGPDLFPAEKTAEPLLLKTEQYPISPEMP